MKKLIFMEDEYNFKELWGLHIAGKNLFSKGDVYDPNNNCHFDISKLSEYRSKYAGEIYNKLKEFGEEDSLSKKMKKESKMNEIKRLENLFKSNEISPDELKALIKLKYTKEDIRGCMSYSHFIFLNTDIEVPDLSDGDLGKYHKILMKMSKKANSLLRHRKTSSNPLGISEIGELLEVSEGIVYKFISRLRSKDVVREFSVNGKKGYTINPKYAINGVLGAHSYFLFREDMRDLFPDIPEEIIALWEYEYMSTTIIL